MSDADTDTDSLRAVAPRIGPADVPDLEFDDAVGGDPVPAPEGDPSPAGDPAPAGDPSSEAPGSGAVRAAGLLGLVAAVDEQVDRWFEPLRGSPGVDAVAKVVTGLGDHGIMWAATTVWRARHSGPERARSVRALAIAGVESSLVNAGIKAVVGRDRPDQTALTVTPGGVPVRTPTSSSFPSGHTLAAFCAATVMSQRGDAAGNALLFTGASLVGLSRLHLRAHHASDVVGGALIGSALGLIGRRFL